MGKIRYPKCPCCGETYIDKIGDYELMHLATQGWTEQEVVRCHSCNKEFRVTVKIMYYGSKLNNRD